MMTLCGTLPRYRLSVGVETASFSGLVEDLACSLPRRLFAIGGSRQHPVRDLPAMCAALAPYGTIPLWLQLVLLQELDACQPFSLPLLLAQLATICDQTTHARLPHLPVTRTPFWLQIREQGWCLHLRPPKEDPCRACSSPLTELCCLTPPSHPEQRRPILVLSRDHAWPGPLVVTGACLGERQVARLQQDLVLVPAGLRLSISALWYRAWRTRDRRGGGA